MNPLVILLGLLVVAYIGSILIGGRAIQGFGLPSGTEFLLVGLFLGPEAMGLVSRQGLQSFEALTIIALGWMALVTGAHYGVIQDRPVTLARMAAGIVLAALAFALAGGAACAAALLLTDLTSREAALLALGVGAVSAETTRHAVRWVTARERVEGPLSRLIAEISEADDAVPFLGLCVLFALVPQQNAVDLAWPAWALIGTTLAAGAVMGATCAALFDVEHRTSHRWGIILGTALLALGASMRLGLSAVSATFVMGVVAARLSKGRGALRAMLGATERTVMLPALMLAGAHVTFPSASPFIPIAVAAFLGRVAAKAAAGAFLSRSMNQQRAVAQSLGFGLMPAGILTMTAGLACSLRFPGRVGQIILGVAAMNTLLGELLGPALLRRALRLAGEASDAPNSQAPARVRPVGLTASRRQKRGARGSLPSAPGAGPS